MKILAIITIVISIPTLVASFYGMNVQGLPVPEGPVGFYVILGGSVALALLGALLIVFLVKLTGGKRK